MKLTLPAGKPCPQCGGTPLHREGCALSCPTPLTFRFPRLNPEQEEKARQEFDDWWEMVNAPKAMR